MATYTKETALYNTGAIGDAIDEAGTTASNFIAADSSGIMVYDGTDGVQTPSNPVSTTNNVFIDDNSLDIRTGTVNLASFGAKTTIGKDNSSRMELSPDGLSGITDQNVISFTFSNNGGSMPTIVTKELTYYLTSEVGTLTFDFSDFLSNVSDGETLYSDVWYNWNGQVYAPNYIKGTSRTDTCSCDYTSQPFEISYDGDSTFTVTRVNAQSTGEIDFYLQYAKDVSTPCYTFGNRNTAGNVGGFSFAHGENVIASGKYSFAQGSNTEASGNYSHAEGWNTVASGQYSHAQGLKTIASKNYQTVIGTWNIEDTTDDYGDYFHNSQYAFIIGNGEVNTRSNAFMVDWSGDIYPQATKMADFVIEQDVTNSWVYRKWNSGIAECWKTISLASNSFTATGNIYYRTASGYSFPSNLFTAAPVVSINADMGNIGAGSATNVTKTSFAISLASAVGTARAVTVSAYAIGKWK